MELHGASLVASTIWNREGPLFPEHQVSSRNHHRSPSIEKCGIMLVLKGVVVLHDFIWRLITAIIFSVINRLTCTVVTVRWTNPMIFDSLHLGKTCA